MQCDRCAGAQFSKAGRDRAGRHQDRGRDCRHRLTARTASAVCGFPFPDDIIALVMRWYLWLRVPYAAVTVLPAASGIPCGVDGPWHDRAGGVDTDSPASVAAQAALTVQIPAQ